MCLNIHIDFYNDETQTQSKIWDPNSKIKSSEKSKVDDFESTSELIIKKSNEYDRKSELEKRNLQIGMFSFLLSGVECH